MHDETGEMCSCKTLNIICKFTHYLWPNFYFEVKLAKHKNTTICYTFNQVQDICHYERYANSKQNDSFKNKLLSMW